MDGLDAITERILAEAQKNAQVINTGTANDVDLILAEAKSKAIVIAEKSVAQADKEAVDFRKRTESLSALETRKIILAAKQKIIDDVMNQAILSLKNMKRDVKVKLYIDILKKIIIGGEVVQFNQADSEFADEIKQALAFPVSINPMSGNFDGGVIVVRDTVEINMTFEMIAKQYRSELVTIAADSLFSKE